MWKRVALLGGFGALAVGAVMASGARVPVETHKPSVWPAQFASSIPKSRKLEVLEPAQFQERFPSLAPIRPKPAPIVAPVEDITRIPEKMDEAKETGRKYTKKKRGTKKYRKRTRR